MNKERLSEIFKALVSDEAETLGSKRATDLARSIKPDASIREILLVAQKLDPANHSITPKIALEFVRTLVEKSGSQRLFIPFAFGVDVDEFRSVVSELDYVVPTIRSSVRSAAFRELVSEKTGIAPVPEEVVESSQYDVVYSDFALNDICNYSAQKQLVEKSLSRLGPNGLAVFIFADKIVYWETAKEMLEAQAKQGVFVSAILDLTDGLYEATTPIGARALIFTRKERDSVFLAKLEKGADVSAIVDNFLSGTSSSDSDALGRWVKREAFPRFISSENERRRRRIAKKLERAYDGTILPISEISDAVVEARPTGTPFDEAENDVYLLKHGKFEAATNLNELRLAPENYVQILANQEKVLPEFLKFFFNTDKGAEICVLSSVGVACELTVEHIKKIEIPVPSLETQRKILNVYDELNQIELEASRLKNLLRETPASYAQVTEAIKEINDRGDKFERWIESLPYPLATILKRYAASDDDQHRQETLFFFFEAYSIFAAAILSAAFRAPFFRDAVVPDVELEYFKKSSFGSWVMLDVALAKEIRTRVGNREQTYSTRSAFHTEDASLVNLLCEEETYSILQSASNYRNSWKGHSGITNDARYSDHVRTLHGYLLKLRERSKNLYDKIRLVRPIRLKRAHGEFINTVESLTGSNPIFNKDEIVGDALDEDKLYIHVVDTNDAFELPPFFLLKNSPAEVKNACYFYSRLEGANSRYVSYHFEGAPESTEEGEEAFDYLQEILERGNEE